MAYISLNCEFRVFNVLPLVVFCALCVDFTRTLLRDLCNGRLPSVYIDRFRNHCSDASGSWFDSFTDLTLSNFISTCCSFDLAKGKEILTLQRECHARRLDALLRVLLVVQQLLQENRHESKRDIYYIYPAFFQEQSVVDRAINDICIILQCSRHHLNVVSVGKGLVMGWLRFSEAGRKFDCINNPNTVYPIPVHVEEVKDIISVADYVLIVEKESEGTAALSSQFSIISVSASSAESLDLSLNHDGRGYPDVSTRRFLQLLIGKLRLPVYGLVDCDPHGFDILTTYRFGSMQMAYDAKFLRLPEVRWIGAFPSDLEKFSLPPQCLLPLTTEEKAKTEAMLQRCYLLREVPQWRSEVELLLQKGVKFEIEALSVHSISFLTEEYIPSKIQAGLYI
ncbi:hypothetical protein RJ639_012812 [Escallonia herrerae]|uniref:DNA topoisomerase (ATP-hydrolyzing) n=1 Tax=Escallonia herrerae TaxID=1293975 RepID=A0AA88VL37_9ASTE|nr:hypothetical protein RJ639_012812 [Escallonia herrerae]